MTNIVIIGSRLNAPDEKADIQKALRTIGGVIEGESVITVIPESWCYETLTDNAAPYLVVYDTDMARGEIVAELLCTQLGIDVELRQSYKFFPKPKVI